MNDFVNRELVVSPNGPHFDVPHANVPVPATLWLIVAGVIMIKKMRKGGK